MFDDASPAGSALALIRQQRQQPQTQDEVDQGETSEPALTAEEKEAQRQRRLALKEKQRDYLHQLINKKKKEEAQLNETKARKERAQKRAREAAQLNQDEAKRQLEVTMKQREDEKREQLEKEKQEADAKMVKVDVEAMVSRLSKLAEKESNSIPEARDFEDWKKRQGIEPETKVFSITGWYPAIKQALEERGWYYNPDRESRFFDLKWTLKSDNLKNLKLNESQVR